MSATMLVVAVAALAFAQLTSSSPSEPIADPVIPECTVEADRDIPLPAEEAGVLVEVLAREGAEVTAGDLLALPVEEEYRHDDLLDRREADAEESDAQRQEFVGRQLDEELRRVR